jgi:hypothetical protein
MITLVHRPPGGMLWVGPARDRRSWGILAARSIAEEPVDRVAGVEIAQNAIPTPAWTAPRTRRPQRPTRPTCPRFDEKKETRKMTRLQSEGGSRDELPSSLRSDE